MRRLFWCLNLILWYFSQLLFWKVFWYLWIDFFYLWLNIGILLRQLIHRVFNQAIWYLLDIDILLWKEWRLHYLLTSLRLAGLSLMLIFTYIDFTNIVFFGVLAKALHAHDVHFHFILLFLLFFNEIDLISFRVISTVQRLHVYGIDII